MVKGIDLLRQQRLQRPEEVKREGLPLEPGVLALHHRGHALQAQLDRGVTDTE